MRRIMQVVVCVGLLWFNQSPFSLAEHQVAQPVRVASLDTLDGPPPCGQDGKCNLNACSSDPDCPPGVSESVNHPTPHIDLDAVIDCNSTQKTDIQAVAWNIADDWINFRNSVESQSGTTLGQCLYKRFAGNGEVECVDAKCNGKGCKMGFGGGLGQKVKIFQTFLDTIAALPQADRRACYAALLTHEFSHTCEHYAESGPEAREDAAFAYWKARFPVTSTLDVNKDCDLD